MARVVVFAAIAGLIGLLFGGVVLFQYIDRRKPYQFIWACALTMFGLAAVAEAVGLGRGWTAANYQVYYVFGALLNVGWLAVGEVYLVLPGRPARAAVAVMAIITVISVIRVFAATANPGQLHAQFPSDRTLDVPAVLPAVTNSVALLVLVAGPLWSAWKAYRRTAPWGLVAGLALIAAGAGVVGLFHAGSVVAHYPAVRPISEAVGIAIMFAGYLVIEAERAPLRTQTAS